MRCQRCGSEVPEGSRFCPMCGASMAPANLPVPSPASDVPSAQGDPGPAGKGTSVFKVLLFVALIGAVVAFGTWIYNEVAQSSTVSSYQTNAAGPWYATASLMNDDSSLEGGLDGIIMESFDQEGFDGASPVS
jgi:hypothetical protein